MTDINSIEAIQKRPVVTIIQRVLPHYRLAFFEGLHERLEASGISLKLIYGQEYPGTVPVSVELKKPWAERIQNHYIPLAGRQIIWQPAFSKLKGSNLIIVEQASALLLNYILMARRKFGQHLLAYWGHGRNFQARESKSLSETLKAKLINEVDWWFAYTALSGKVLENGGYPKDRLTVVNNSIDTESFKAALGRVSNTEVESLRRQLGISDQQTALFCGSMYDDKKLDFLLDSARLVKAKVPGFHLIAIGSGPEQYKFEQAARQNPWIHYAGPRFGAERATYFKASQLLLMPGLVGLAIIDAFTAETPLFTTDLPLHSPEIAYLEPGINGHMTAHDPETYASAVSDYLKDPGRQQNYRKACKECADRYNLNAFVNNFAAGIEKCLEQKGNQP